MEKISVVILTLNEERNIGRCLESVQSVADEIIVVDSFSTDNTEMICKTFDKVRFFQNKFEGYIEQKNFAKSLAVHDKILSLDADESLSKELLNSIIKAKSEWKHDGYSMNRLTNYCGKWIRHSGWYPDRKLRLFDRTKGYWGGVNPHDKFVMNPGTSTFHLHGDLLHYSYYSIEEHELQVKKFAEIAARSLYTKGESSGYLKMIYKPFARFIKSYILNAGFKDGREGFIISKLTAKASYLRYRNLFELNQQKKH